MKIKGTKIKPEKQDTLKGKASFAGQASSAKGEATPTSRQPRRPGRAYRDSRRRDHFTNHSTTTHIVNQCGVSRRMIKWQPFATWRPLPTK